LKIKIRPANWLFIRGLMMKYRRELIGIEFGVAASSAFGFLAMTRSRVEVADLVYMRQMGGH